MSATRLQEVIDKYDLYTDLKRRKTSEEIILKMRKDIVLDLISAEVVNKRTGQNTTATVAFTLSYEGKSDPAKVQRVASVLASLFLEENVKVREKQTQEASAFFEDEKNKIEQSIDTIESEISSFKKDHINELPESVQAHIQDIHLLENNIERSTEQLRSLKEKEAFFASQAGSISTKIADQEKLSILKLELNRLNSLYSNEYPDIVQIRREIDEVEKTINENYSSKNTTSGSDKPTNPAYINLLSQLSSIRSEIFSAKQQIDIYENRINKLRGYIKAAPVVEQDYRRMLMERDSLRKKYDDLMQKFMEARVALGLERGQKGERFTLIDPALLPEKPYKPNRLAIFLIGMILAIGSSVGLTVLLEATDDTIRDTTTLSRFAHAPVLSVVPVIFNDSELAATRKRRATAYFFGVVFSILFPLIFHFLVMDIYVFWAKLMRNLNF